MVEPPGGCPSRQYTPFGREEYMFTAKNGEKCGARFLAIASHCLSPANSVTFFAAVAMVSNIRYHSFKHLNVKDRVSFVAIIAVVLLFVLISLDPPQVLFLIFLAYAVSGPLFASFRQYRRWSGPNIA